MKNEYTLVEKYYSKYQENKEKNFINVILDMLADIEFEYLHQFVDELIQSKNEGCEFQVFGDKNYLKLSFDDCDRQNLYIRPINNAECNMSYIKEYYKLDEEIKGVRIADHISSFNLEIYADSSLDNVVFNTNATGEHKNLLITNKSKIRYNNFDDFDYIIWLVSILGDYLFEFEEKKEFQYTNILEMMQNSLDKMVKEYYKNDECEPVFNLSVMNYGLNAKIVLSVEHRGLKFSEVVFPHERIECNNGFNLYEEMISLYNRTM